MMPPLFAAAGERPATIRQHVRAYLRDDAWLPNLFAGRTMDEVGRDLFDGDLLGAEPQATIPRISAAARAAASELTDGAAPVHGEVATVPASDHLWQRDIARCFLAHDVAMHLGSRACPFTEELACGMWEGTWPDAARWRERGMFGAPLPLPDDVSWRDRFLLCAGRDPHPLRLLRVEWVPPGCRDVPDQVEVRLIEDAQTRPGWSWNTPRSPRSSTLIPTPRPTVRPSAGKAHCISSAST